MADQVISYGRLDEVLRSLGFTVWQTESGGRRYKHETGAQITMPDYPMEREAFPHHLGGARMQVDGFGIASEEAFDEMLRGAPSRRPA